MATCSIAEQLSHQDIFNLFSNDVNLNKNEWSKNPYSFVFNFKEMLQENFDDFNAEWFNEEMSSVFNGLGLEYSAKMLDEYEKNIPKKKENILPDFTINKKLSDVFKGSMGAFNYALNELNKEILYSSFLNLNTGEFITSDLQMNKSIINFKNTLFDNLKKYLNLSDIRSLYETSGKVNYDLYQDVMNKLRDDSEFSKSSFDYDVNNTDFVNTILNPYYSFVTLLNFDRFISELFNGVININQSYKNTLDFPTTGIKYTRKTKGEETVYWNKDTEESKNPALVSPPAIKKIANSIPVYNSKGDLIPNQYFGLSRIFRFGNKIKEIELGLDTKSFRSNPRERLIEYLNPEYKKYFNRSDWYSLKNYIDIVLSAENKLNAKLNKDGVLSKYPDIISNLAWEMDKTFSPIYSTYLNGGKSKLIDFSDYEASNGFIRELVINQLLKNKVNSLSKFTLYAKDLNDKNIQLTLDKLAKLTGIQLSKSNLEYLSELSGDEPGELRKTIETLSNFIKLLDDLQSKIKSDSKTTNDFSKYHEALSSNVAFNNVANAYMDTLLNEPINIIRKQNNDGVPVSRILSFGANDKSSIESFNNSDINLIKDNTGLLKGTVIRLEVITDNSEDGKPTSQINTAELLTSSFFGDFLSNYKDGNFITQSVAFSDKPTDIMKMFNLKHNINGKQLLEMSNSELRNLHSDYNYKFFSTAGKKVLYDLLKIFNLQPLFNNDELDILKTYNLLNNKLKESNKKELYKKGGELGLEIVDGLHFNTYKEGIRLNRGLFQYIFDSESKKLFDTTNKINYLESLINGSNNGFNPFDIKLLSSHIDTLKSMFPETMFGNPDLNQSKFFWIIDGYNKDLNDKINNLKERLLKGDTSVQADYEYYVSLLGKNTIITPYLKVNGESIYNISKLKEILDKVKSGEDLNIQLNPLFERYMNLTNLFKDSYLQLTTQFPYLYGAKVSLDSGLDVEHSEGFKKMSKRMVSHTATIQNYQQGLKNGVPSEYILAIINDPTLMVGTYMGHTPGKDLHEQDVEDGSAKSHPVMNRLEQNSLPNLGVQGTQKPFWAVTKEFSHKVTKFAKFEITNELVRISEESERPMGKILEKMSNIEWKDSNGEFLNIDLTRNYLGGSLQVNHIISELGLNGAFINIGGKHYTISSLKRINFDTVNGSDYKVFMKEVNQDGSFKLDENGLIISSSHNTPINSIHELWNVFGGAYSEKLVDGKLRLSETSNDIVTHYVINTGTIKDNVMITDFPLKTKMVAAIINGSAQKVGQTNVNPVNVYTNSDKLNTYTCSTKDFGVQLDAGHEADDSELTEPTQVISAIAALGNTSDVANTVYSDLADLMKESMKDQYRLLNEKTETTVEDDQLKEAIKSADGKTYEYLSKWLIDQFKNANVIGLAQVTIDTIIKDSKDKVPFSAPSIYGLFITNLLSNLNRNTLRRKIPGLGMVLNPSAGVVQIYQLGDKIARFTDVFNEVSEFLNKGEYTDDELETLKELNLIIDSKDSVNKNLVLKWLDLKYPPERKHCTDIQLCDSYREILTDELGNETLSEIKTLVTPQDLQLLHSKNIEVMTVNKPRDLKPREITWVENENKKSIWTTDAIKISTNLNNLNPEQKNILKSYLKSLNLDQFKLSDKEIRYEVQKWVQSTFDKLHSGYNYLPLEQFKIDDDYNWKDYFDSSTPILNYTYKKEEAIIPKVYKSAFGLSDYSMYEIESKGVNFFKDKLELSYEPLDLNVDILFRLKNNNIHVIVDNSQELKNNKVDVFENDVNIDGKTIRTRIDESGNKMYDLPGNSYIVMRNGVEIVVLNNSDELSDFSKSVRNRISSVEVLGNHTKNIKVLKSLIKTGNKFNKLGLYKKFYRTLNSVDNIVELKNSLNEFYQNKDIKLDALSSMMYSSFLKSKDLISARIPSQALQSYMTMNTVGYTESESNDGYVSIWQIVLQGSDFDVDKAYTMLNSINDSGVYNAWSPFFDYSSIETLRKSENLPKPNGKKIEDVLPISNEIKDNYNDLTPFLNTTMTGNDLNIDELIDLFKLSNNDKPFGYIPDGSNVNALVYANEANKLIDLINEHNLFKYSEDSVKNRIFLGISKVGEDLRNQISATSPISMDQYTDITKKVDTGDVKNMYDGQVSVASTKEANYDGKATVGIMANGLKSFFALTQYFNEYYKNTKNISVKDNTYFLKNFNLLGKNYVLSTISDTKLSEMQKDALRLYLTETFGDKKSKDIKLLFNEKDGSLNLSALTSLATDNAKELALAKLNAGINLASIHVYLTILGLDPETVSNYMMNDEEVLNVKQQLTGNVFLQKTNSLDTIVNKTKYPNFYPIFKGARELRSLNSFLKLNQGTSSDSYELHDILNGMSQSLLSREAEYLNKDNSIDIKKIITDKPYLKNKETYINDILENAEKYNLILKGLNVNEFVSNTDYRKAAIDYYNILKSTFNILDVVASLPHFNGMLQSLNDQMKLGESSNRYNFIEKQTPIILNENKNKVNDIKTVSGIASFPVRYDSKLARKANNFYDDYIITEWLKTPDVSNISINLGNLIKSNIGFDEIDYFNENGNLTTNRGQNTIIDLQNIHGIASFKKLMEDYIIPYLKKSKKGNAFISNLIPSNTSYSSKYKLSINTSLLVDPILQGKFDIILQGFNDISNENSNISMANGSNITFGDLFFLYNLITNKNRNGNDTLSIVFQNYAKSPKSLNNKLAKFYSEYDSKNLVMSPNNEDLLFALFNTVSRGERNASIKYQDPKEGLVTSNISLNNKYYTFNIDVMSIGKEMSKTLFVNKIINSIKSNIVTLEVNCNG